MVTYFLLSHHIWLRGQAVKTSPFHGGNTGSIPVGVIENRMLYNKTNGRIAVGFIVKIGEKSRKKFYFDDLRNC